MFLLPAIGAGVSDTLILYLYFSHIGSNDQLAKSNGGRWAVNDFFVVGITLGLGPVFPDESHSLFYNEFRDGPMRNIHQSSPKSTQYHGKEIDIDMNEGIGESSFATVNETNDTSTTTSNTTNKDHDKIKFSAATAESKTVYLVVLAIIRLLLLMLPLSYAAWSGTRVPCAVAQYVFHGISSFIVVCRMLAVLTLEPTGGEDSTSSSGMMELHPISNGEGWTLLLLSLVSIMLHILIVLHVRSTGPNEDGLYEEKRKRKRLAYAMAVGGNSRTIEGKVGGRFRNGHTTMNVHDVDEKDEEDVGVDINSRTMEGKAGGRFHSGQTTMNSHDDDENDEEDVGDRPFLLPPRGGNNYRLNKSLKDRLMCLPETFLNDTQARFDATKQMWTERLEIMTQSLQQNSGNMSPHVNKQHNFGQVDVLISPPSPPSPPRSLESTNLIAHAITTAASNASKLAKPDPFRVLLQLFAYEDVWSGTNNRLDTAFSTGGSRLNQVDDFASSEGSAALAFYAPQLLSFLLHGAYFDISSKLEEWILKKCGQDLHFAHRCFWFLRSWCLGSSSGKPSHRHSLSSGSSGGSVSLVDLPLDVGGNKIRGIESNLYLSSCQGSLSAAPLLYSASLASETDPPGLSAWDNYSGADGFGLGSESKFSPEDQELIKQLLYRIVEQGSRPATAAQYGSIDIQDADDYDSSDKSNGFSSPSALATAMEQGLVPVDPRTGSHSMAHLDCITSPRNHGFLPLNNSGEPYKKTNLSNDADRLFFAAPIFLDALLSIADDLMNTSRPNRTTELRNRLRSLEVELLPSNVVYLPIRNMEHRVWRICSDESLALSTNERVPCIVTLEVIDYGMSGPSKTKLSVGNGSTTLAWVYHPRHPQRHGTLIDIVANYTHEGLKRLEDTIDHLNIRGDGRPVLDRRLSEILGMRDNAWTNGSQLYTSVRSYDDDDSRSDEEDHCNCQDEDTPEVQKLCESSFRTSELTEIKSQNEEDLILQPCPSPPLCTSSLLPDGTNETPKKPSSLTPTFNSSNNVEKSPMGQWSTPKMKNVIMKHRPIGSIAIPEFPELEEKESDDDVSPQAKYHKQVVFPPTATLISRDKSSSDESRLDDTACVYRDVNMLPIVTPAVVFKEDWKAKTERVRRCSVYGSHPGWRLLPILIKSNDDLRQEQLASQLIQRMATILAKARVPVWLFPYEIVALTGRGGIIECVPDTISIDSLKRNDPDFTTLKSFFIQHFGHPGSDELADAKANFVESLAAYSIVCFLMQIKDRHNGNILLDNKGHIIHIDFGFYFLSSPGKNSGFESAPFKLTRDFVALMDGPSSRTFQKFRELCYKTFLELRKHCYQIILLVEMITEGNEDLACFRGKPDEAVRQLKERFRLDLNDNGVRKYVDSLIDESVENWRTRWYDRYQRFCVGVM